MKTVYKFIYITLLCTLFGALPSYTHARDVENNDDVLFCSRIENIENNVSEKIGRTKKAIITIHANRGADFNNLFKKRAEQIKNEREGADRARKEHFRKMEATNTDPATLSAIRTFEKEAEQAITIKRKSIDEALVIYKEGVKSIVWEQDKKMTTLVADYEGNIKQTLGEANMNCRHGEDGGGVRNRAKIKLSQFEQSYQSKKLIELDTAKKIEALKKIQEISVQNAENTFKMDIQLAESNFNGEMH